MDATFTNMTSTQDKILSQEAMVRRIRAWRVWGESIVFTNGCFDLLHLGHVDYLEKAGRLGDRLVVGLNADTSVGRLKGADRPLLDENSRARILAALEFVDGVVVFAEDTPQVLIEALEPDVLVKGMDYAASDIVGGSFVEGRGGKIERIELVEGHSTTALIEKIRKS